MILDKDTVEDVMEHFTYKLQTLHPKADKSSAFEAFEKITGTFTSDYS